MNTQVTGLVSSVGLLLPFLSFTGHLGSLVSHLHRYLVFIVLRLQLCLVDTLVSGLLATAAEGILFVHVGLFFLDGIEL